MTDQQINWKAEQAFIKHWQSQSLTIKERDKVIQDYRELGITCRVLSKAFRISHGRAQVISVRAKKNQTKKHQRTIKERNLALFKSLLSLQLTLDEIAEAFELSMEQVEEMLSFTKASHGKGD